MESTPRWPTTGTGLTTQSHRTEEESFATRGNFAVVGTQEKDNVFYIPASHSSKLQKTLATCT